MPVTVRKRAGKYRVCEAATGRISRGSKGAPHDGGGHESEAKAKRQARAINKALEK